MPELRRRETVHFDPIEVDPIDIPYKDKIREKRRQLKLSEEKEKTPQIRKPKRKTENDAWSKNKEKLKKKEAKKKLNKENDIKRNKRKLNRLDEAEIDELVEEARLVKKLKSGKISKVEFEERVKDDDPDLE
jgi:ATP-dependent RNA helicase DDX55/SPB4